MNISTQGTVHFSIRHEIRSANSYNCGQSLSFQLAQKHITSVSHTVHYYLMKFYFDTAYDLKEIIKSVTFNSQQCFYYETLQILKVVKS